VSMANRHAPIARTATKRASIDRHVHGKTVFPFGAWDWGWGWGWGYSYPGVAVTTPIAPATEAALAPPVPEALPPCQEIQAGVTIIRGKSCRA
jgi:hypothetical protein